MSTQPARVRGIKDIPRTDHALLLYGQTIVTKWANNANFPNQGSVINNLSTACTNFETAIKNAKLAKVGGEAVAQARQAVVNAIGHVVDLANSVVEQLPADAAKTALQSGGISARKLTVRLVPDIDVKYGGLMGVVLLVARSMGRRCSYAFAYSTDQKTWTSCPTLLKVKTTVSGLTVGTTYYFRVQATTPKGPQDWSTIVSFVVH
jgi:hypothetical protein